MSRTDIADQARDRLSLTQEGAKGVRSHTAASSVGAGETPHGLALPRAVVQWPAFLSPWRAMVREWWVENRAAVIQAVALVVTLRIALEVVGFLGISFLPENRIPIAVHPTKNFWIDMWLRWDAIHYLDIANRGYRLFEDLAFFPLYPFLIRNLAWLTGGDTMLSGLFIATVTFVTGLYYLYKLVELEFDRELAARTVQYLALAPMAFFFLSVYTEPLFLTLSVGAIYHARKSQWLIAGVFGALAVLTRPPGMLLLVPLGYEALQQWRKDRRVGMYAFTELLVLPTFLVTWMIYMQHVTGNPLAFVAAQSGNMWHRRFDLPWHTISDAVLALQRTLPHSFRQGQYSVDLIATLLLIFAAVIAFWYLPRIYALYLAASVVVLLMSRSDPQVLFSMPRFAMVQFPAFILLAMLGRNPRIHHFIITVSVALLGMYTALFVSWYWIA